MGEAALRTKVSEQEYLAFERASEGRHEYIDGEIFAMSGGTRAHSLIATNIVGALGAALRGREVRCPWLGHAHPHPRHGALHVRRRPRGVRRAHPRATECATRWRTPW